MFEKCAPASFVLLGAFADAEYLPITVAVHTDRDIAQGTGCSLNHGGSLLAVLVAHLQFSQIRGRQPYSIVRNIPYVITHL